MDIVYSPQAGGILDRKSHYPWFSDAPNTHRREVHCGEAEKLILSDGDLITITNVDGGISASLLALGPEFSSPAPQNSTLNNSLNRENIPLNNTLNTETGTSYFDVLSLTELENAPIDLTLIDNKLFTEFSLSLSDTRLPDAKKIFDNTTLRNEKFVIRSQGECVLWVILPKPIDPFENGSGGSLLIEHAISNPTEQALPQPLGTINQDIRVKSGTANAYLVKKGEYIQVIDVEGRQCSDFMAVRSDALADNKERYIDSTVTRSMVHGAYPRPGLYDKFFDQDMQPLLEVIQDTVGRHDTFALACTARVYEEQGFPGHVNCSDNITKAYTPYGIAPRTAWPAINFFFNSTIDPSSNLLSSEEAWSRPGDYVVMKALTDLICVNTACPDDIDPVNGWNPTDIHVRVYDQDSHIPKSIVHRPYVESEANMTQESAFHPCTSKLTQSYSVARDLWLPDRYDASGAIEEYWASSQSVTIQDMSSLRKYDIAGPDAERLLQLCLTKDINKLAINRGLYALMCSDTGYVIDDGTLFRMSQSVFRWCCGSEESARQLKAIAEKHKMIVWVKGLWSSMPNLAIQGPKSRELLSKIIFTPRTQPALENVKWFGCTIARLHDRNGTSFLLSRSGFTGELGYEIFCDKSASVEIWDTIMTAGEEFGIKPMGNEALEMKRIEAGLMSAGAEFTPEVDAFEAGLGFAVDMRKAEFIGRDALARNMASPKKVLIGLKLDGTEVPSHNTPLFVDHHQVGVVTSATYSPALACTIMMARVAVEYSELGSTIEIGYLNGHLKRVPATVVGFPFIDPKRERARA